ncbi:hypothetical protein H9X96_17460 [Pedobacter sp. N36a]|uniref:hypothetical protein n=1 Tax=Pedobacter sp. N36a TaxID=2767996 RepID=UPI001656B631|nr:hypothetical protein [Pedobacter sp. N36a]MBC8987560.1 hypothetical protein [Pedobacter sp. N36a]
MSYPKSSKQLTSKWFYLLKKDDKENINAIYYSAQVCSRLEIKLKGGLPSSKGNRTLGSSPARANAFAVSILLKSENNQYVLSGARVSSDTGY